MPSTDAAATAKAYVEGILANQTGVYTDRPAYKIAYLSALISDLAFLHPEINENLRALHDLLVKDNAK